MIRQERLRELAPIVEEAVVETFELARKNEKNPNDFVLFLTNAFKLKKVVEGFSPLYPLGGIGAKEDILDLERLDFFKTYIQMPYEVQYNSTKDSEEKEKIRIYSIHSELMIYTHFWESKANLKTLKHIANLVESQKYKWEIEISDYGKSKYISDEIINVFKKHNLKIANVINDSYHSQIRNAFAHSQYSFSSNYIHLGNYNGEDCQMKTISFEDWEDRFMKTALLFDMIFRKKQEYKREIGKVKGEVEIYEPNKKKGYNKRILVYIENSNSFIDRTNLKSSSL